MSDGLREREELRDLFGRHVGEDVARAAIDRGIELGGEELEVAVLFVDLVGSTSMAAERPPRGGGRALARGRGRHAARAPRGDAARRAGIVTRRGLP